MTYQAATDRVIAIIEATTRDEASLPKTRGLFGTSLPFVFDEVSSGTRNRVGNIEGDELTQARAFSLTGIGTELAEHTYTPGARIRYDDVEIMIQYPPAKSARDLDLVMHDDAALIQGRLMTESLWDRPTSTIESIGWPAPLTLPIEYVSTANGRATLIRVRIRHTEATS